MWGSKVTIRNLCGVILLTAVELLYTSLAQYDGPFLSMEMECF